MDSKPRSGKYLLIVCYSWSVEFLSWGSWCRLKWECFPLHCVISQQTEKHKFTGSVLWSKASAHWSGCGVVPSASPELDLACVFSPFHSNSERQHFPSPEPNLRPWHHWLGCSYQTPPPRGCVLFGPGHCSEIRRLGNMGPYRGPLQKRTGLSIFWVLNDRKTPTSLEKHVKCLDRRI